MSLIQVVAAVIEHEGKVLIAQRKASDRHPFKWEFPGGKMEPGENPRAALKRELAEELAIEAKIGTEITRYEYEYPHRPPILLIFYRVTDFAGEPQNLAFEQIKWEQRTRLSTYDFLDGDTDFVRLLAERES